MPGNPSPAPSPSLGGLPASGETSGPSGKETHVDHHPRTGWRAARRGLAVPLVVLSLVPAAGHAAVDLPVSSPDPAAAVAYHASLTEARARLAAGDYAAAEPVFLRLTGAFPDDSRPWSGLADCRYHLKRYAPAAQDYLRAVELGVPFPAVLIYDAACCRALAGQPDSAMATLRRALAEGFENRPLIGRDEDLISLHDHPDWPEMAGLLPDSVTGRTAGWRYDLDFWMKEVRRLHPAPFAVTPEPEFLARVKRLHDRIPELSDEQVMIGMVKLSALLGDGHSGIRPLPDSRVGIRMLPLQLYAFADGLFVIDADSAHAGLIGARVLNVGDRAVDALWPGLAPGVPRDNPMRILQQGPFMLTVTAVLRGLGAIGDTETVPLRIRDAAGVERTVRVESQPGHRVNFELIPSKLPGAPAPPLYLAHADEVLWMGAVDGGRSLYVEFNVVRDGPQRTLAEFAGELERRLTEHPEIDTVIMDVRHNGGGNSFLYPPLVKALVHFEEMREDSRLYVLIGRQTFSACQNFITDLDTWTNAVFAGEPSGSRPNMVGESTYSVLPYSGLRAGISSRYHQESYPGDDRRWIAPDLPVALDSRDYFANRDPVLEAVLAEVDGAR